MKPPEVYGAFTRCRAVVGNESQPRKLTGMPQSGICTPSKTKLMPTQFDDYAFSKPSSTRPALLEGKRKSQLDMKDKTQAFVKLEKNGFKQQLFRNGVAEERLPCAEIAAPRAILDTGRKGTAERGPYIDSLEATMKKSAYSMKGTTPRQKGEFKMRLLRDLQAREGPVISLAFDGVAWDSSMGIGL